MANEHKKSEEPCFFSWLKKKETNRKSEIFKKRALWNEMEI